MDKERNLPMDWFIAIGYEKGGILRVAVSEIFTRMAGGEVGRHFNNWYHFRGNPVRPDDPPERAAIAKKATSEAKAFILQATGFSPREVFDMANELQKQYRGKKESPLKTELY